MPIPESSRVIFAQNPLQEVICQLRFPTILQINSEGLPKFQERVRSRFPLFQESGVSLSPQLNDVLKQLALSPASVPVYEFINESESMKISLCREYISLSDFAYERWEDFKAIMQLAYSALEDLYKPAFYTRIGLRYRDIIDPQALGDPDVQWIDLFRPELVGILGSALSQDIVATRSETKIRLSTPNKASAVVRYGLVPIQEPDKEERHAYAIDTDFFTEEKIAGSDIFGTLDEFNRLAGNLFRWAITDKLRAALEPRELEGSKAKV